MSETFEGTIEGHQVSVDLGPLAAWEARAWMDEGALGAALALVLVVAVLGLARRGSTARTRSIGGLAPVVLAALAAGAVIALASASQAEPPMGSPLALFPELARRFEPVGKLARLALAVGLGGLVGVACDLPAFIDRAYASLAVRAVLGLIAVAPGALSVAAAEPVREHRDALVAIAHLPFVALPPVELHPGQTRTITVDGASALGLRAEPSAHWFSTHGPTRRITDAGSTRDRDALARGDDLRVALDLAELDAWRVERRIRIEAPRAAGPFRHATTFERGPVTVVAIVEARAIDDAPDPSFPLAVGDRWVFAQARRRGRVVVEEGTLALFVSHEEVVDGFLQLVVSVTLTPATDAAGELVTRPRQATYHLVPREGGYHFAGGEGRFIAPAPPPAPDAAPRDPARGERCVVHLLEPMICDCREEPRGPRICALARGDFVGDAVALGIGLVTAGLTWILGMRGGAAHVVELRLVEVNGATIETPSELVEPPRPRSASPARRRARAR